MLPDLKDISYVSRKGIVQINEKLSKKLDDTHKYHNNIPQQGNIQGTGSCPEPKHGKD
jgi:hypothetical protein